MQIARAETAGRATDAGRAIVNAWRQDDLQEVVVSVACARNRFVAPLRGVDAWLHEHARVVHARTWCPVAQAQWFLVLVAQGKRSSASNLAGAFSWNLPLL